MENTNNIKLEEWLTAIKSENLEKVTKIINSGLPIDIQDEDNWTGLMHACDTNKKTEIIELLIKSGANINAQGIHGYSPLLISCEYNLNEKICELLIKKKCDINIKDNYGWTGLIHASQYDNKKIVEILLINKADVNIKNNNDWTALMFAKEKNMNSEIVKLLNAFSIEDINERILFIVKNKFVRLFEMVMEQYKSVFYHERDGITFLHLFNLFNCDCDLKFMESLGMSIDQKCNFGWSGNSYRIWSKRKGNINYLLSLAN